MCGSNDPHRLVRILDLRAGLRPAPRQAETTCLVRRRAYATVDRDVAHLDAPATTHYAVNTGEHGQQEVEQDVWVRVEPVFAVDAAQVKEESTPPTRL